MQKTRKAYAPRLNKDPIARKQIAVLKLAGLPTKRIAEITGRYKRTIDEEITRDEHKKLMRKYTLSIAKLRLPREAVSLIENALDDNEDVNE